MKTVNVPCPICGPKGRDSVLYRANFKASNITQEVFSARRIPDRIHYRIVQCSVCGLVRSSPVLPPGIIEKLYTQSLFTYQDETAQLTKTYLRALLPVLDKLSYNDHLLEIGCGNGFILYNLKRMGYTNVYGVEPSKEALSRAHAGIKKNIRSSVLKPGLFPGVQFDFIFFFQTLDHIADPNAFLAECFRLLAPGGYILSFHHNIASFSSRILKVRSPIIDIEHTFLYSPKTTERIFTQNGFVPATVYSPINNVSLKHLLWLSPLPKQIKLVLLNIAVCSKLTFPIQLGNLCIIAQKPFYED